MESIRHSIWTVSSWEREGLSCSALYWAGLTLSPGCSFGHHIIRKTLNSLTRATRVVKGLEGKPYQEGQLRSLCSAWRRGRLRGDLIVIFNILTS